LTPAVPDHFELYALGAGFLLALAVAAIGASVLVRRGLTLRKKALTYKRLPFASTLELTQARLAIASRSVDRAPGLLARARSAFAAITAALSSLQESVLEARDFFRAMLSRS
jgi:hypothetical protein